MLWTSIHMYTRVAHDYWSVLKVCNKVYGLIYPFRSSDGLVLAVSSSDGYCSLVGFEPGELGEPLQQDKLPTCMQHTTTSSTSSSDKDSLTQNNSSPSINVIVPRRIRPAPVQTPSSTIFDQNSSEEPISSPPPQQAGKKQQNFLWEHGSPLD